MLTDRQITDIAREYAEELIVPCGFSKGTYEELVDEKAEDAAYVLRWLSKRYHLVEKSKALDEYKSTKHDSKMANRERLHSMLAVADARKALLESLFPEIAKEVEE